MLLSALASFNQLETKYSKCGQNSSPFKCTNSVSLEVQEICLAVDVLPNSGAIYHS